MTKVFNRVDTKLLRRQLRRLMPKAEVILWSRLKNKQLLDQRFRRQYSVKQFVWDFYCPHLKLAIELDGNPHFLSEATVARDAQRQAIIEHYDIRVLRFTNDEVYHRLNDVLGTIGETILELQEKTAT
jgi:very-short-patch-repair endonuclease